MNNMTGAEKAKEIRNSIFAMVLFACLFLIGLFYLKLLSKEEEES